MKNVTFWGMGLGWSTSVPHIVSTLNLILLGHEIIGIQYIFSNKAGWNNRRFLAIFFQEVKQQVLHLKGQFTFMLQQ